MNELFDAVKGIGNWHDGVLVALNVALIFFRHLWAPSKEKP